MKFLSRRTFLFAGALSSLAAAYSKANAASDNKKPDPAADCLMRLSEISTENIDSPFFEHFHRLAIPISSLIKPPQEGLILKTGLMDMGSYNAQEFEASGLNAKTLLPHIHEVAVTQNQLDRIATGEKDVEIRVITKKGIYVHNFFVTAPPSALIKVRKGRSHS